LMAVNIDQLSTSSVDTSSNEKKNLDESQLVIVSRRCYGEEIITKNGVQKNILVVVKNSPFHLNIAGLRKLDFNQFAFDSHLVYDCDGGQKEVDYVRSKPFEFKAVPSENGQQLDIELRIKVLSSQHEDMLFKVIIIGYHPVSHEEIPGIFISSPPIKVISKPEQVKKKQTIRKRTLTSLLMETISRIEKKQEEQQKIIEKMIGQQGQVASSISMINSGFKKRSRKEEVVEDSTTSSSSSATVSICDSNSTDAGSGWETELEASFSALVNAFLALGDRREERIESARRLLRANNNKSRISIGNCSVTGNDASVPNGDDSSSNTNTSSNDGNDSNSNNSSKDFKDNCFNAEELERLAELLLLRSEENEPSVPALHGRFHQRLSLVHQQHEQQLQQQLQQWYQIQRIQPRSEDSLASSMISNDSDNNVVDRAVSNANSTGIELNYETCSCVECPHKRELERIDEFYKEFLCAGQGL